MPSWATMFDVAMKIVFGAVVVGFVAIIIWAVVKVLLNGGRPL